MQPKRNLHSQRAILDLLIACMDLLDELLVELAIGIVLLLAGLHELLDHQRLYWVNSI
jgi:hypothetical protein